MTLMKRGMPVYRARMTAMFIIAVFPLTVLTTQYFGDVGRFRRPGSLPGGGDDLRGRSGASSLVRKSLHHGFRYVSQAAVGSVTGIGAMAGGLGGVLVQKLAGSLTDTFKANPQKAYLIMFVICALSYLLAWSLMKALVPRHEPITDL